jgi:putative transposase
MAHSFDKIWIHAVWSTKLRVPLIRPQIEQKVYDYLDDELRDQGCLVKIINGMPDHIHCLFRLNRQKSVAEVIKQVKGCSSHLINQTNLIAEKFSWQTGYAAFSLSENAVGHDYQYIKNQKTLHQYKSFRQELNEYLGAHGFETMP